jgi:3-carboxy-cis,cis-muconate cycloisomerase
VIEPGRDFVEPRMAEIFSAPNRVQRMLDFEAALARAEADAGVIPRTAADAIAKTCTADWFDIESIRRDSVTAGNWAIPLVKALTAEVDESARGYVHWGATSQDAIDTAMVLQMRAGIDLLVELLAESGDICSELAERHRATPMAGRTLLQQAVPITFGLKAAHWLELIGRAIERLSTVRRDRLFVQFGGAAGTLASLGEAGPRVTESIAEQLGLQAPDLPWHADRDRVLDVASAVGIASGSVAKIAGDALLLMQSEVGELREGSAPGKGGSSTMPHKRNPVDAMGALASARLASGSVSVLIQNTGHQHERGAGPWQVEWAAVPDCFCFAANAADRTAAMLRTLEVDVERMAHNLRSDGGLSMAESLSMRLAEKLGKKDAHELVEELSRRSTDSRMSLLDAAKGDERVTEVLSAEGIETALDPTAYTGLAETYVDRAVARYRRGTR